MCLGVRLAASEPVALAKIGYAKVLLLGTGRNWICKSYSIGIPSDPPV